jgi:signal transduction histidine kinase
MEKAVGEMTGSSFDRRSRPMAFPRVFSLPQTVVGLAYLIGYVLLDWVSFIHPFAPFGITPWNPPTGLSFILILLFGQRFLPLVFLAPLLADLLVRHLPFPWEVELLTVAVIGAGYSIGLLWLLRPGTRFNPALATIRDLIVLLVVAALSAAFVATTYVGILVAAGLVSADNFVTAAVQFWVGDMIGIAVVSPCGLIFLTRGPSLGLSRDTALHIVAIAAALAVVFLYAERHQFQLFYILFLPIIWMAVRGGLELVTVGILLTQLGLVLGLHFLPQEEINVTAFQALMLVLTMTGLIAGALVTEHRRTEFQLRLHQDSLARVARLGSAGELAAAVAHEINQPLMAAGTYTRLMAEMLGSRDLRDASAIEVAGKAVAQVERAAEVVKRLRALIRLDQSGRAPANVERIVRESLDLCRPDLDRHNIRVRVVLQQDLPQVMVDLLQIEQVLLNLIRNAIEAMSEAGHGGAITISAARPAADKVEMTVEDTGPGFPPGFTAAEVPPFSSTKAEGLGIGLSLARSIVESHGGRLQAENSSQGAVVRLTLPIAASADG